MQPGHSTSDRALGRLVVKNTFYLTASQALTVPIAILVNGALARFLGAADFGLLFLASTLSGFGFLVVNWGHENALPTLIARDRGRAGVLLGSSLIWRCAFSVVVYATLASACMLLHYGAELQWALALSFVITGFAALIGSCKDTVRGFERTDIPAYIHVGQQFLTALCVVPALFLGGKLRVALFVQIPVSMLMLWLIWRTLRPVGVGPISFRRDELKTLMSVGTPFVFLGLAATLQPNVNAVFLSVLVPSQVMGWFAVSWRLIGALLFPASALVGALYPTLCRLFTEDRASFVRISRGAFSSVAVLSVPIAMGCYLYPEIGVALSSRKTFAPAEDNLRYLAPYLFLLYFSMPVATCVLAAGRQRAFSLVQALCVVVSAVLDPILIPWYQRHSGNGGLGVCAAAVISEAMVVALGMALTPRGVFDRSLLRSLFFAGLSGAAMALAAWLMRPILSPFLAAPLALVVYGAAALLTGAVDKAQLDGAKAAILRKFSRGQA